MTEHTETTMMRAMIRDEAGVTFQERDLPGGVVIESYCVTCGERLTSTFLPYDSDGHEAWEDAMAAKAHRERCGR